MDKQIWLDEDAYRVLDPINDLIIELKNRIEELEEEMASEIATLEKEKEVLEKHIEELE